MEGQEPSVEVQELSGRIGKLLDEAASIKTEFEPSIVSEAILAAARKAATNNNNNNNNKPK